VAVVDRHLNSSTPRYDIGLPPATAGAFGEGTTTKVSVAMPHFTESDEGAGPWRTDVRAQCIPRYDIGLPPATAGAFGEGTTTKVSVAMPHFTESECKSAACTARPEELT
jgi:hypothetical protein